MRGGVSRSYGALFRRAWAELAGVTEFRRLSDGAAGGRDSVDSIHNAPASANPIVGPAARNSWFLLVSLIAVTDCNLCMKSEATSTFSTFQMGVRIFCRERLPYTAQPSRQRVTVSARSCPAVQNSASETPSSDRPLRRTHRVHLRKGIPQRAPDACRPLQASRERSSPCRPSTPPA